MTKLKILDSRLETGTFLIYTGVGLAV